MQRQNTPKLVDTVARLREEIGAARRGGRTIGFVPTMGALHEGHLSLVRAARNECDYTVVSIFVNPSQFGLSEDFARYPRTLEADLDLLAGCGADLAFVPAGEEVYRPGHDTWVEVGAAAEPLEGQCRPGHFRGVATAVLKLLNMVQPDAAYFGQKDYQQALVIRRMAADLDLPTAIRVRPIVREPDGLAMSSRNRYLTPAARQRAMVLWKSLQLAGELVEQGERDARTIAARMRGVIETAEDARIDYVALVDPETLQPVETIAGATLAALAVKIENTRLIDNCILKAVVSG
ncbi:MAG: pantoate--beta-alanine ligase [Planctomycetes bacterium]|nr:pantoate--beta-alanine ligase [Planctomycetota bacterium]MBU4397737.1 pantoate--beta-alanine ligase [Planctomycetota bacterium]MCG2685064.1 pantoate--beta-alanine ligase [Planctomycetales bacterium]